MHNKNPLPAIRSVASTFFPIVPSIISPQYTVGCVCLPPRAPYYHLKSPSEHSSWIIKFIMYIVMCGPGSSVGIATDYRLDGPGIESRWGWDFPPVQTGPGAHPASCKMGTGSFPGVKCGRGVLLITHSLLVPRSWKSRAIPLPTLWATPSV